MKSTTPKPTPYTVNMAIASFLEDKAQQHISAHFYHRLRRVLGLLTARYGHLPIASLTARRVKAFLFSLSSGCKTTNTFNNQRNEVQAFLLWAKRNGF